MALCKTTELPAGGNCDVLEEEGFNEHEQDLFLKKTEGFKENAVPENKAETSVYAVEKIIAMKTTKGVNIFLVKWEGYDSDANTWEPKENIEGSECCKFSSKCSYFSVW